MKQILQNIPDVILSAENKELLYASLQGMPDYSVRMNPRKLHANLTLDKVAWCNNAYYLNEKPQFSMDPLWHAGAYYVQEAGSMFIAEIVKHLPEFNPEHVLDLCASPGGKTTLLAGVLPDSAVLVANEVMPLRLKNLQENITKWGHANCVVTNSQPYFFTQTHLQYDLVLVDAPCSGEGLLRRNEVALEQWSPRLIEECSVRQREILEHAVQCIKPGGYLIYSTCTYNTTENEDTIAWMLENLNVEAVKISLNEFKGVVMTETGGVKAWRFFPGLTRSEGFFVTVLRKPESRQGVHRRKLKGSGRGKQVSNPIKEMVDAGSTLLFENNAQVTAFTSEVLQTLESIEQVIKVVQAGTKLGQQKGKKFVPDELLHWNTTLKLHAASKSEVDYETAIRYLNLQSIAVNEMERGYRFLTYKGVTLGLVNVLDNRVNNNYPSLWKLLKPEIEKRFELLNFTGQ